MYQQGSEPAAAWAAVGAVPMPLVSMPVVGNPPGGPGEFGLQPLDPRLLASMGVSFAPQLQGNFTRQPQPMEAEPIRNISGGASVSGLKYAPQNVVLAAGQYREIRPAVVAPQLVAKGGFRFHIEPAELPPGLQFDPASGTVWGTPATPPADADPSAAYSHYAVVLNGPAGSATAHLALKVIDFQPSRFRVTHVSQLERNKYIVLVDTRNKN